MGLSALKTFLKRIMRRPTKSSQQTTVPTTKILPPKETKHPDVLHVSFRQEKMITRSYKRLKRETRYYDSDGRLIAQDP